MRRGAQPPAGSIEADATVDAASDGEGREGRRLAFEAIGTAFALAKTKRGQARREAILDAAKAEFLAKGFRAASIRKITRDAGGSAETLYSLFRDKTELFAAVIACNLPKGLEFGLPRDQSLRDQLLKISEAYLNRIVTSDSLPFFRMMIGESASVPEIARVIWENGTGKFRSDLARYFGELDDNGLIDAGDPEITADIFIGMLRGNLLHRVALGYDVALDVEIPRIADRVVAIFLGGCGTGRAV